MSIFVNEHPHRRPLVAVDAGPATKQAITGTELYARELALRLPGAAPEIDFVFYSPRPAPRSGVDTTVLPFPRLWSQARLPVELARRHPDLFFAPSHVVPFYCPVPALTVVHDLAFERFPRAYRRLDRRYLQVTTRWAERVCPILLAVSQATRDDLVALHGVDPGRVIVVHPGGGEDPGPDPHPEDARGRLAQLGVDRPFVLQVGRIEPRKNQLAALAAVEQVPDLLLACAGAESDPAIARSLKASPKARVLGRVDDTTRDLLYRNASALVVPSLHEGFGFPVLEAMARGLPVVTTRASSLPEVAGEAALYVDDPNDAAGLAAQLRRLLDDTALRLRLAEAGRAHAAAFTWASCAAGVAEVIRDLVRRPPRSQPRLPPQPPPS